MYGKVINLLLIEDDKVDQIAFNRFAVEQTFDFNYQIAGSISDARELLAKRSYDIIISDYFLGDGTALDILKEFKNLPLIVVTGAGDEAISVNAMKMGAYDYLSKDVDGNYLLKISIAIDNVLKRWNLEQEVKNYHENLELLCNERTKLLKKEIAERITIQHSLEDSEKKYKLLIEKSIADKDKYFSIISHDLRNPLTTINDIAQKLDDKLEGLPQKEIKDLIRTLRKKTSTISELLKELLD